MHTKRITISLPEYLYAQIQERSETTSVSAFVAEAIADKLLQQVIPKRSPLEAFEEMCAIGERHPMTREKIRAAIDEGRA